MTEHTNSTDESEASNDTDDGEVSQVEECLNNHQIPREAVSVTVKDDRPVIEIGGTRIHLETHYVEPDSDRSFSTVHDDVSTQFDVDGDAIWWTIYRNFSDAYVEIDPTIEYLDEEEVSADD